MPIPYRVIFNGPWRGLSRTLGKWGIVSNNSPFCQSSSNISFYNSERIQRRQPRGKITTAVGGGGATGVGGMSFFKLSGNTKFYAQIGNDIWVDTGATEEFSATGAALTDASATCTFTRGIIDNTEYLLVSQAGWAIKKFSGAAYSNLDLSSYSPIAGTVSSLGTVASSAYGAGFENVYAGYGITYVVEGVESAVTRTTAGWVAAGSAGGALYTNLAGVKINISTASDGGGFFYPQYTGPLLENKCKQVRVYRTPTYPTSGEAAAGDLYLIAALLQGANKDNKTYVDDNNSTAGSYPDTYLDKQRPYDPELIYKGSPLNAEFMIYWRSMLFTWGASDHPNRLYYSMPNLPTHWVANAFVRVGEDNPSAPMGMAVLRGHLYLFKETTVYEALWNGVGMEVREVMVDTGCVAKRSLVAGGGYLWFYSYTGIEKFNGVSSQVVSLRVDREFDEMGAAYVPNIAFGYNDDKLWVSYADSGATNNSTLVFDTKTDTWSKQDFGASGFIPTPPGGTTGAQVLYNGDPSAGWVYQNDVSSLTESILAAWKSPKITGPGKASRWHRPILLWFITEIEGAGEIDINIYFDGNTVTDWSATIASDRSGVYTTYLNKGPFKYAEVEVQFPSGVTNDYLYELGMEGLQDDQAQGE